MIPSGPLFIIQVSPEIERKRRWIASQKSKSDMSTQCPYLDTIDRNVLDFDFEKLCSVSLSRINVYACLVCGKYFQVGQLGFHISQKPVFNCMFCSRVEVRTRMHIRTVFPRAIGST